MENANYEPRDEISLRELYLVFRAGLVGIVLTAALVGGVAFIYLASRPLAYEATATVQLTPPQAAANTSDVISLLPQVGLGLQAYTSVARGTTVLQDAFGLGPNDLEKLRELSAGLELKAIDASGQARGQLTIEHRATAGTAKAAAERANAWATASAGAATAAMQATVTRAVDANNAELAALRADLAAAQAAWAEFAREDARAALSVQIDQLALQQAATTGLIADLDAQIAANGAQQALLVGAAERRGGARSDVLADQVKALVDSGAVPDDAAASLTAALGQLPPGITLGGQDLMNLVSRAKLEALTADMAGRVAQKAQLQADSAQAEAAGAALRERLADLDRRAAEPEANLRLARQAYDRVAAVAPLLGVQKGMVADAARVIIAASEPLEPKSRSKVTIAVAAALVAGLLATLLVFLRAAVADPNPPHGPVRKPTEIDQRSGALTHHDDDETLRVDRGNS